ncbi:MAG: putative repeat protein (TIGR01451 family), partial [Sphingobacteriales bacterium]
QDSICTPPFVGVLQDNQGNCDAGIGVEGIGVQIEPGSIQGVTNSAGVVWLLDLPDGNYTATLDTVNNPFVANCGYEINFAVQGNKIQGTTPKFYVAELIACPKPIIGIKNVRARSCDKSSVRVNVSQLSYSGAPFTGGQVRLRFSEYFLLDSATVNYSTTNPNEYLFELNGINIGEGKVFDFFGTIDCNAPMGISLCFEAEILDLESCIISRDKTHENDLCSGDWDNSSLAVYSTCVGDSVVFEIRNVGQGNMECPSEFNVFLNENHYLSDSVQLDAQMSYFLTVASQGEGMVLNADQHPMHPGNSHPMTFIEACGSDQSKWESGKRMRHADDDKEDYKDIHCSVVRNSYDPNDKTGFPMGLGNENIIEQNQDLTYVVNFQNTGNDTAYVVVVRDTLDSDLDFFSVMPLGASHEYSYRPLAGRVLEWTFSNINLLDSASNEEKSNGYFSFKVKQHKDLALETKITNRVGIYFDHNPPIITNTAMHTIGDLNAGGSVGVVEKMMPLADELIVVPNPNFGLVRVVNKTNKYINKYSLVDLQGRVLRGGNTLGNSVEIDLHNVPPGIYIFKSEGTRAVKIIKK